MWQFTCAVVRRIIRGSHVLTITPDELAALEERIADAIRRREFIKVKINWD